LTGQYQLTLSLNYHSQTLLAYGNLRQFLKVFGGLGETLLANRNSATHLANSNTDLTCQQPDQMVDRIITTGLGRPPVNPF